MNFYCSFTVVHLYSFYVRDFSPAEIYCCKKLNQKRILMEAVVTGRFVVQPQNKIGMECNNYYFATNCAVSGYNFEFWWKLLS